MEDLREPARIWNQRGRKGIATRFLPLFPSAGFTEHDISVGEEWKREQNFLCNVLSLERIDRMLEGKRAAVWLRIIGNAGVSHGFVSAFCAVNFGVGRQKLNMIAICPFSGSWDLFAIGNSGLVLHRRHCKATHFDPHPVNLTPRMGGEDLSHFVARTTFGPLPIRFRDYVNIRIFREYLKRCAFAFRIDGRPRNACDENNISLPIKLLDQPLSVAAAGRILIDM